MMIMHPTGFVDGKVVFADDNVVFADGNVSYVTVLIIRPMAGLSAIMIIMLVAAVDDDVVMMMMIRIRIRIRMIIFTSLSIEKLHRFAVLGIVRLIAPLDLLVSCSSPILV